MTRDIPWFRLSTLGLAVSAVAALSCANLYQLVTKYGPKKDKEETVYATQTTPITVDAQFSKQTVEPMDVEHEFKKREPNQQDLVDAVCQYYADRSVNRCTTKGRKDIESYVEIIWEESAKRDLDPTRTTALLIKESDLNPYATTPWVAGMAQIGAALAHDKKLIVAESIDGPFAQEYANVRAKYDTWMQKRDEQLRYGREMQKNGVTKEEKAEHKRLQQEEDKARFAYSSALHTFTQQEGVQPYLPLVDDRFIPESAIPTGIGYYDSLIDRYAQERYNQYGIDAEILALNAYNTGPGRVDTALRKAQKEEKKSKADYLSTETNGHEEGILAIELALQQNIQGALAAQ